MSAPCQHVLRTSICHSLFSIHSFSFFPAGLLVLLLIVWFLQISVRGDGLHECSRVVLCADPERWLRRIEDLCARIQQSFQINQQGIISGYILVSCRRWLACLKNLKSSERWFLFIYHRQGNYSSERRCFQDKLIGRNGSLIHLQRRSCSFHIDGTWSRRENNSMSRRQVNPWEMLFSLWVCLLYVQGS